jgi:hypothetical protein
VRVSRGGHDDDYGDDTDGDVMGMTNASDGIDVVCGMVVAVLVVMMTMVMMKIPVRRMMRRWW